MFIYKITNTITQKSYIGQTKRTIQRRFKSHISEANRNLYDTYLHRSIRKYGKENFIIEMIEECNQDNISEREIFWIQTLNTKSPNGYNLHDGGYGGCLNPSDELKQKLSNAKKGKVAWNKGIPKEKWNDYTKTAQPKKPNRQKIIIIKICALCFATFVYNSKRHIFCSRSCSAKYQASMRRNRMAKKDKIPNGHSQKIKSCPTCDTLFVSNKQRREKLFCSKTCAMSANAKKVKNNGMKNETVRKKFSEQITGRKRKYNDDGTWFWYYPEKQGDT